MYTRPCMYIVHSTPWTGMWSRIRSDHLPGAAVSCTRLKGSGGCEHWHVQQNPRHPHPHTQSIKQWTSSGQFHLVQFHGTILPSPATAGQPLCGAQPSVVVFVKCIEHVRLCSNSEPLALGEGENSIPTAWGMCGGNMGHAHCFQMPAWGDVCGGYRPHALLANASRIQIRALQNLLFCQGRPRAAAGFCAFLLRHPSKFLP